MKKISPNTIVAILVPLAVAIIARTVVLIEWFGSPFRYYHGVPGLDMATFLDFGRRLYNGHMQISLHRVMVALTMFFNHGEPSTDAVIIMQMLLGIPVGAMMGYVALHLTGNRWWALLTGLIAALYSPFLIHECFLTKDALVPDLAALSLFLLVWGRKYHYKGWRLPLVSLGLFLPFFAHISTVFFAAAGYLWLWYYLRWNIRRMLLGIALPVGTVLVLLSIHVYSLSGYFMPIYLNIEYAASVSAMELSENALNLQGNVSSKSNHVFNYLNKGFQLVKPYEIPNNINHYFVKHKMPFFNFLPGPLLLIPFAGVAVILLLLKRKWRRRFNLPLLYLVCYAIPIIAFMPLARYRMILCPALAVMAPYVIFLTLKLYREKRWFFPLPMLAVIAYATVGFPGFDDQLLRATDFVAYGHAQKFRDGNTTAAEQSYMEAIGYNPGYLPAVINVADIMIKRNDAQQAAELLQSYHQEYPESEGVANYYGIALLHSGRFQAAANVFASMTPPANSLTRTIFYYYWAESLRMLGQNREALAKYREGLKTAAPDRAAIIERAMASLRPE